MTKFSLLQNDDSTLLEKYPAENDFSPKNVTSHPHPICMTFCLDSWHYIKVHEFATSFYLNWRIYSKIKVGGSHKSYVEDNSRKRSHICADEEMQFWSKQEENRPVCANRKGGVTGAGPNCERSVNFRASFAQDAPSSHLIYMKSSCTNTFCFSSQRLQESKNSFYFSHGYEHIVQGAESYFLTCGTTDRDIPSI